MWGVALIALIYIAVASCNAELYQIKTADLKTAADNRIIGGSATTIEQYPFAVQVHFESTFYCGGCLVTQRHVLSAAHAFVAKNGHHRSPSKYSIRAATTILYSGGSVHFVIAITVHELYNFTNYDNDVAVALMATPIDLTTSVARLAHFPKPDAVVPDNSSVIAVGWGRTDETKSAPATILNEVTVRKINLNTCRARYRILQVKTRHFYRVTSNMICTGILDVGGKDMCLGDSGGPLLYKGIVVGITSWGIGCARPQFPGVSVRIAKFTNWINYTINNSMLPNGTGKSTNLGNTGSLSSKVGAITLLTPLLYLILSV